MSTSKLKNKNLGDLAAMKNFFNGNLIEMIKPLIKQKSNESVLKMMDIIKDKPESWFEFLSLAIFHQNIQIVKYMIENFAITPSQTPLLNALSFANDILPDNSNIKQSENKETYQDIECPLVIQAAIGGDIEILKYLISKGFNDIDNVGHIALSKKQRNSVVSNAIGAAAYYGRISMLEYLLKTYERKVDINLKAIEKKGKKKHMSLTKEYSGFNAVTLAIAGEANDDTTIEVMKILDKYKVNEDVDFKENNMLHIAARFDKLKVVKHIIEDLDMERLAKETNKDGQTPYSVAESVNAKAICDYLRNNTEKDNKELEDDLKELIESGTKSKKKKKKQNKGKKDDGLGLLNSSDYQETLKIEEKPIVKKKTEEIEEEESEEIEEFIDDKTKTYNNNNNYKYNNNRNEYNNRRNKQYGNKGRYYNNNYDDYYGNKNYNNKGYYNKRNNYQSTTLQKVEVTDNTILEQKKYVEPVTEGKNTNPVEKQVNTQVEEEEDIIVGLAKKNKNKGKNKKKKEEVKEEPKEIKVEEPKIEIEPVPEEKKEEPPKSTNENIQQLQPMEEAKESNDHVHEEATNNEFKNVDDEEDEESEEDFLHEYENEPKDKNDEKLEESIEDKKVITSSNPVAISHEDIEYKELLDKYNELEKKYELLRKEKEEMETFIRKSYQQHTTVIPSTEENINDLMELANSELESKNKRIEELEKKIEMYTLHDIHSD